MCFQYLNVSGHLMIRKVDDRLFYFKSLALSSYIYFLVEDKEGPAVKLCEKPGQTSGEGEGGGGGVGNRWKNIYQEGNSLIAASCNRDHGEPLLQLNPASNSASSLSLTLRHLPLSFR